MARLAGVSESWYRALESGQQRSFSEAFLLRVAEVLKLSEAETVTLFLGVAGRRPPAALVTRNHLNPKVLDLLGHQAPYPAYLSDGVWNIIAANVPMAEWFPWSVGPRPNLMRWTLLAPEAREQLLDWESNYARVYLAMLRVACNRDGWESPVGALVDEILTANADCRRIWAEGCDVVEHRDGHTFRLRLPVHGHAELTVSSHVLLPIQWPDLRFVVITPDAPEHDKNAPKG